MLVKASTLARYGVGGAGTTNPGGPQDSWSGNAVVEISAGSRG
jgi:hypothetical protein